MKRGFLLGSLLGFALAGMCHALAGEVAPPQEPPLRLPTSPAEVTACLQSADAAETHAKDLTARWQAQRNAFAQAAAALRSGPFQAANGLHDARYLRLSAVVADLDAQMKAKRDAMVAADKAHNADERAALEIEHARLRTRKDAAQAAVERFVLARCLALPAGKAAAEQAAALADATARCERQMVDYSGVLEAWREVASGYRQRQKPAGYDLTKVRELVLPPPADAAARQAAFAHRNDAAALAALAERLFAALDETAPGLQRPFALYRQGQPAAALDAFREYFFDKLANLEKYGIPADAVLNDERPPLGTPLVRPQWVDDALRGIATQPNRNVSNDTLLRIAVGPPGAVNWAYVPFEPLTAQKIPVWLQVMRQFHLLDHESGDSTDGLRSWLIDAYQAGGEVQYLRRWAEYADDWALNMQRDLNALAVGQIPPGYDPDELRIDGRRAPYWWNVRWYPTLIARQPAMFVTRLRALVLTHPEVARELPAATLARVLLVATDEYLSPNILVARATRFNWNMMGLSFNVRNGLLLGEFKAAQWAGREAARTFQNHALFSLLPDGGYVEYSDEGHQGVWLERATVALSLWRQRRPDWFTAAWEDEFRESITRNAEFFLRHLKSDGYRHRDDYRYAGPVYVGRRLWPFGPHSLDLAAPWVTQQPEPRRILATVFGKGEEGLPQHRSDVMPCLGEFLLRGGWGKDDPFFYMHSGRIPNSNTDEDCNGFKLHAFGRHLLTAQPVYVDGRTQNSHFQSVDNVGAKTAFLTHSDGLPIAGRWHASDLFDFAEGVYEGAYEDRLHRVYWSTFHGGGFDLKRQQRSLGLPPVTDVQRHTRQVFFLREPAAWVVVDRIHTAARHEYEVPLEFFTPVDKPDWLRRKNQPLPNAEGRVVFDEVAHEIRTGNPGFPRVSVRHFCSQPVHYAFDPQSHDLAHKSNAEIADAQREWRTNRSELRDLLAFFRRTLVRWSGTGNQVLVTLITVAPADADPAQAWTVTGQGTALHARSPDGTVVDLVASPHPAPMAVDNLRANGDTLLVVRPAGKAARGIVLGATLLQSGGPTLALSSAGGEFAIDPQLTLAREIHAPIAPVQCDPPVNVFTDRFDVSLRSATPGVEIRYTLDGSEPTSQSPRYEQPLPLTATTVVRAIAIRPGVGEMRWPLDPGYASLPTRAVFTRQAPAVAAAAGTVAPGLNWEYAAGQSFALVAHSDTLPAQKRGATDRLFDVTMHAGGSAFVCRYEGFLDVPADGVYTLHAPREFVIPDIDPGYDLRVFLDGEEWWPTMRWHALGTWSRALARGRHRFRVIFVDTRTQPYKYETWQNWPNLAVLWKGVAPVLEISGPGLKRQPVPSAWLSRPE